MFGTLTVDGWAATFGTATPPSPLLAVPNATAHPSTVSVPTSYVIRCGTIDLITSALYGYVGQL